MLDDIRNCAGDILSGKMKDAEIALTKQESAILRLKIEGLLDEANSLREERVSMRLKLDGLTATIANLTMQLEERDKTIAELKKPKDTAPNGFDAVTKRVVQFIAEQDGVSHEEISRALTLSLADVRFHVGALIEANMADQVSPGMITSFGSEPPLFDLTQSGRTYARQ